MKKKEKVSNGLSDKTSDIILVVFTAIILFIVAYPLYYVLVASLLFRSPCQSTDIGSSLSS